MQDEDKYYVIYAYVSRPKQTTVSEFEALSIAETYQDAISMLQTYARKWVCDEVGKNNYQETLSSDLGIKDVNANSYMLKFSTDNNVLSVDRIELSYVTEVDNGWIRSVKDKIATPCGYFSFKRVNEFENSYKAKLAECLKDVKRNQELLKINVEVIDILNARIAELTSAKSKLQTELNSTRDELSELKGINSKSTIAKPVASNLVVNYGKVANELKTFDRGSLRKVHSVDSLSLKMVQKKKRQLPIPPYVRLRPCLHVTDVTPLLVGDVEPEGDNVDKLITDAFTEMEFNEVEDLKDKVKKLLNDTEGTIDVIVH
jgi:hypothetical protein